jgi:serine/threonine-protein kinase RsbW
VDVEIKVVLFLPRDAASVPVTRNLLDGCLETLGVTPDIRTDIALALSEACANVIQHAGPGDAYEVIARARDGRCIIEVLNTGSRDGAAPAAAGALADGAGAADPMTGSLADSLAANPVTGSPVTGSPVPLTAEHGRGLKIMNAVVDDLRLTGDGRQGTTVHFEKELRWIPGAAGEQLFSEA